MMSRQEAINAFFARAAQEREKAVRKYGEIALLPGGDPDRDIFDYTLNECVGLLRYAEMMENRVKASQSQLGRDASVATMGVTVIGERLRGMATECGVRILLLRDLMQQHHIELGEPENPS
jgi:hypothetical protein